MSYYEKKYGRDLPLLLAGDFNNELSQGREFKPLWERLGLRDSFEAATTKSPAAAEQQYTHSYVPEPGSAESPKFGRVDMVAISPVVHDNGFVTHAEILRDLDKNGKPRPSPKTTAERLSLPSDHRMITIQLNFERMLQKFRKLQRFKAHAY
jgi:hypothetical protein